jgi:hypothetical protein
MAIIITYIAVTVWAFLFYPPIGLLLVILGIGAWNAFNED